MREHYIITKNAVDDYDAWKIELPADYFASSIGNSIGVRGNITQAVDSTALNVNESAVLIKHAEGDYQIWPIELPSDLLENHVSDGFSCRGTIEEALHGVGLEDYFGTMEYAPPIVSFGERRSPYRDEGADGSHESDGENYDTPKHPINFYIENAHDANIGGFTISLPATRDELQPFLVEAEIFEWRDLAILEVESDIKGLGERLYDIISDSGIEPSTLDELNYLATRIETIAERGEYGGIEIFSANIEAGRNCGSIAEMINLTLDESLNQFDVHPVFDAEDYGDILVNQFMADEHAIVFNRLKNSDEPEDRAFAAHIEKLEKHINKAAFGRATAKEENGVFTEQGYLSGVSDGLPQLYQGVNDIPNEHCLLSASERDIPRIMKIDNENIAEAIVKLHAVGCRNMENAAHNVASFFADRKRITGNADGNDYPNHFIVMQSRSDISIAPVMDVYRRGGAMNTYALTLTDLAATDETRSDIKVFALRVNNAHGEEAGSDLRGDLIELSPQAFNAHITRYAATPDRVDTLRDGGEMKSYDLFEWGQKLLLDDKSVGSFTFKYPEAELEKACNSFVKIMGSHEMMCIAESFEFHLPNLVAPSENLHPDMIPIANEAAREILARGDADVHRLTDSGVVKLDTFEALRPMCFAEYKDLAIKLEDVAGLGKWAERKVGEIVRQAEREERKQLKNKGEEEL